MAVASACLLCLSAQADAATYYVRTDGHNSNCDGLTNASDASTPTTNCAFQTIDRATSSPVAAGDTVLVQPGTYAETVSVAISGTSGNPVTYKADGAVTFCGITATDFDYLRWIGFTIDGTAGSCALSRTVIVLGTLEGWEFWNNTITNATLAGITAGAVTTVMNNWIIIGNHFTEIPGVGADAVAIGLRGADNIVAYNTIDNVDPDIFYPHNNDSYYLNNFATMYITGIRHGDVWQANSNNLGYSRNVYEANFLLGGSGAADEHGVLFQDQNQVGQCPSGCGAMEDNVIRRKVWHNFPSTVFGPDTSASSGILRTRLYNETLVDIAKIDASSPDYGVLIRNSTGSPQGVNSAYLFNTIFDEAWDADLTTNLDVFFVQNAPNAEWTAANYNLAFESGATLTFAANWTNQANEQSNVNPQFVDRANDDFHLQVTSGAIGTGGPLTTTSGTGTGTTFSVATNGGGFFRGPNTDIAQYGGNLTEGDEILIGTDCRTVVSISGDDITVDSSFTWADAESVYYGCDSTPDIGAFPYKAGGYTLSAGAVLGASATVIPNDSSLVRWVVCYNDGIPYTVDNTSPYTCAIPSGTFTARAYPRYASTTLWAEAQVVSANVSGRGALKRRGER